MFYEKNVPNWERVVRVAGGVVLVAVALLAQPTLAAVGGWVVVAAILSAIFMVVTGFVGWCPACALAGRKIKQNAERKRLEEH
jgi:Fe-S cluster biogenesis protein NfuA